MSTSEINKDEALKCVVIALKFLEQGELEKATKFATKAQKSTFVAVFHRLSSRLSSFLPAQGTAYTVFHVMCSVSGVA